MSTIDEIFYSFLVFQNLTNISYHLSCKESCFSVELLILTGTCILFGQGAQLYMVTSNVKLNVERILGLLIPIAECNIVFLHVERSMKYAK